MISLRALCRYHCLWLLGSTRHWSPPLCVHLSAVCLLYICYLTWCLGGFKKGNWADGSGACSNETGECGESLSHFCSFVHCWASTIKDHSPWRTHTCTQKHTKAQVSVGGLKRRDKKGGYESIIQYLIVSFIFLDAAQRLHSDRIPQLRPPSGGNVSHLLSAYAVRVPGGWSTQCPLCVHCGRARLRWLGMEVLPGIHSSVQSMRLTHSS